MTKARIIKVTTCPGCSACRAGTLPDFETEAEESAFWDRHRPEQFSAPAPPADKLMPRRRISIMIRPSLKATLERMATEQKLGYQTLAQELLSESVAASLTYMNAEPIERIAVIGHQLRQAYLKTAETLPDLPEGARKQVDELFQALLSSLKCVQGILATPGLEGERHTASVR